MTDDIEARARDLLDQVAELGGAVAAIEQGFQKAEIERSAYRIAREVDSGERKVVGVNAFVSDQEEPYEALRVDPAIEARAGGPAGRPAHSARFCRGPAPSRRHQTHRGHR